MAVENAGLSLSARVLDTWIPVLDTACLANSRLRSTGAAPCPAVGEQASGYGVSGTIAAVPELQPLGTEGIWRISLEGEHFGRLVRRESQDCLGEAWQLLQLDDIADEQLDAYEAAMLDPP